jgi:hypothetical protein
MSNEPFNPLEWLPQPGQAKEIPGGILYCQSWSYTQKGASISGEVCFRFRVDAETYPNMVKKPRVLINPETRLLK